MKPRTLFLGNEGHILEFIISQSVPVTGVVCEPVSDTHCQYFGAAERLACSHNLPVLRPSDILTRHGGNPENLPDADLVLVNGFPYLIDTSICHRYPLGCVNLHASLLPSYRGRHPMNWAIINGGRATGATLHYVNEDFDTGDIIGSEKFPILHKDNIMDVYWKYIAAGKRLIEKFYSQLEVGTVPHIPQNKEEGSYYPPRKPEDGRINWNAPAIQINNLVRALVFPYPGAVTFYQGAKVIIWKASEESLSYRGAKPGTIIKTQGSVFWITTGKGILKVSEWDSDTGFSPEEGLCMDTFK